MYRNVSVKVGHYSCQRSQWKRNSEADAPTLAHLTRDHSGQDMNEDDAKRRPRRVVEENEGRGDDGVRDESAGAEEGSSHSPTLRPSPRMSHRRHESAWSALNRWTLAVSLIVSEINCGQDFHLTCVGLYPGIQWMVGR